MTKSEFLSELEKGLSRAGVKDAQEILSEYEEHFAFKIEEGKTEEEIAAKLASPKEIAAEYAEYFENENEDKKGARGNARGGANPAVVGVVAASIPMAAVYALMIAAVIVLGAFSVCTLALGFCLVTTINIADIIPQIPYFSSLVLGIASFGLAVLSAVGTVYAFKYVNQWRKCYLRWCKNASGGCLPSLSAHPKISKKAASLLKLFAMIGLIVFVAGLVVGYVSMCIAAKSFEPWHVFGWFASL